MPLKIQKIMFTVLNLMLAVAMSITAGILTDTLSYMTLLMVLIGYSIGMTLSFLIPWDKVSNFVCAKLHIKNPILKILVGGIIPSFVTTSIIAFVMVLINVNPIETGWDITFKAYFGIFWIMQLVAYVVSCFANPLSLFIALKLMKKEEAIQE